MSNAVEHQVVVRATAGMQLSEGFIRLEEGHVSGCLPALFPCFGDSVEEVRQHLEQKAKDYYGHDVYVQVLAGHSMAV